jgi:hypothetical protein
LASPEIAIIPYFGQPVIQTSEPCGKRSFLERRFIAICIAAVARAVRHDVETRNKSTIDENARRP